jgi:tRNA A37 threonylcarbamoyladenosine biosynthesis protein TsaE
VCAIEWGERAQSVLPLPRIEVSFRLLRDERREIRVARVEG